MVYLHPNWNCPQCHHQNISGELIKCPYCKQQNDDSEHYCSYCAAPRSESQQRYHDVVVLSPEQIEREAARKKARKKSKRMDILLNAFLIVMAIGLIIGGAVLSKKLSAILVKEVPLQSATWKSEIFVEKLKTFEANDWKMPEDARLLHTEMEDYPYIDHYEEKTRSVWVDEPADNRNDDGWDYDYGWDDDGGWDYDYGWDDDGGWDYGGGQFGMFQMPLLMIRPAVPLAAFRWETETYKEPVYSTYKRAKYYYEYDAWVNSRTVEVTGEGNTPPVYGELTLAENERERERSITYFLIFNYKEQTQRIVCSEAEYYEFAKTGVVRFRYNRSERPHKFEFVIDE